MKESNRWIPFYNMFSRIVYLFTCDDESVHFSPWHLSYFFASNWAEALALFQNDDGCTWKHVHGLMSIGHRQKDSFWRMYTFVLSHRFLYFPAISTTSSRSPCSRLIGLRPASLNFWFETYIRVRVRVRVRVRIRDNKITAIYCSHLQFVFSVLLTRIWNIFYLYTSFLWNQVRQVPYAKSLCNL